MEYNGYQEITLWKILNDRKNLQDQIPRIKEVIEQAVEKLRRIIMVFPYYTKHDETHSENVLNLMGKLLGDQVEKLSDIEIVILVLSAYLHDVGMFYSDEEKAEIKESREFQEYLDNNPSEYLKASSNDNIDEVIQGFCRCCHAMRVRGFVEELRTNGTILKISGFDILDKVAMVCISHNEDAKKIRLSTELNPKLGYESDLKFCAILLRLADYLDFDGSRTPKYTYGFLNIKNKGKICNDNWLKHINSSGFIFNISEGKELGFCAEVDDPYIEYLIRCQLDDIELELQKCRNLLQDYQGKWEQFQLPYRIDRNQIISRGYQYGEYTFTLKKERILELFMGEQLYADHYVFIREILQNAIDSCEYRKVWEKAQGIDNSVIKPIEIYDWMDPTEGSHYIRIDDYGMGMTQSIIEKYFLKVGQSYYNSDDFKAEIVKMEKKTGVKSDFEPISQFGIGFLSCFLVCDSIEIYTRCKQEDREKSDIIRLSISGVGDFYTMRINEQATDMIEKPEHGGRIDTYGTSMVFKLFSNQREFKLEELVNRYIFCPPTPIKVNGKILKYTDDTFLKTKLKEQEEIVDIRECMSEEDFDKLKEWIGKEWENEIYLKKIPCDITSISPSNNLMGQGLFLAIDSKKPIDLDEGVIKRSCDIQMQYNGMIITLKRDIDHKEYEDIKTYLKATIEALQDIQKYLNQKTFYIKPKYRNKVEQKSEDVKELYEHKEQLSIQQIRCINGFFEKMRMLLHNRFSGSNEKEGNTACQKYISATLGNIKKIKNYWDDIDFHKRVLKDETIVIDPEENKILKDFFEIRKICSISYNGIAFQTDKNRSMRYIKVKKESILGTGILIYTFALRNSLRPRINLARDCVYKFDWKTLSIINLTFQKFFYDYDLSKIKQNYSLVNEELSFKDIYEDPYVREEWKKYKIINLKTGWVSVENLFKNYMQGGVELKRFQRLYRKTKDFFTICSYEILQDECKLVVDLQIENQDKNSAKYILYKKEKNIVSYEENFYPPLFFAHFQEGCNRILCTANSPLNREHPFSKWLLSVTQKLYYENREMYYKIIKCFNDLEIFNCHEIADRLNYIIGNINELYPEYKNNDLIIHSEYKKLC